MKLRHLSELELIAAIRKDFPGKKKRLLLGIGEDAAVFRPDRRQFLLLTEDLLIEGTHFQPAWQSPYLLGRKSLAVNLSDIAAMGGKPLYALLGLGIPASLSPSWVEGFFAGFRSLCQQEKVTLIGGDLSRSRKIVISVTVVGEGTGFVSRAGARPGDSIWMSGYPGLAAAGLHLLRRGLRPEKDKGKNKKTEVFFQAFLDPVPRLRLGQWLARNELATALIDTSDGLSSDLFHLCEESGVGAEIRIPLVPVHPALRDFFPNPRSLILHGGEDYELLFTVPPEKRDKVVRASRRLGLHEIGRIRKQRGLWLVDDRGHRSPLPFRGFQHFRP